MTFMTIGESRVWTPWTVYHLTVAFKHQQELAESVFESVTSTLRTNSIRGDRTATYLGKVIWRRRSIFWVCTTGNSPRSELELWLTREQHLPFFRAFFFLGGGTRLLLIQLDTRHTLTFTPDTTDTLWMGRQIEKFSLLSLRSYIKFTTDAITEQRR